jgi:predicted heme/steroid binding protein
MIDVVVKQRLAILIVLMVIDLAALILSHSIKTVSRPGGEVAGVSTQIFTVAELKQYDGSDPNLPIYLAIDGVVYDVTNGRNLYGKNGAYHSLAGRDSSTIMRLAGTDVIKTKYPVVGKLMN